MAEELQTVYMSDGCGIKVKILGDGPGKPLVITHHGAPGLSTHVEPAAQFGFLADTFRVLVFDNRGSGRSDKQRPYTHAQWISDVEELRQWAKAEKFLMVGASHGGFLTLEYAVAFPDRLYGAIIGDAGAQFRWAPINAVKIALTDPRVNPDPDQLVRVMTGTLTGEEDMAAAAASIMPLYSVPDELKGEVEQDVGSILAGAVIPVWETSNAAMGDCLSRFDLRDKLSGVRVKTLVYVGKYDWICPVQLSEELAEGIPGSKLIVYETSGHMPALEEKTKFQKDAREFIKGLGIPS